MAASKSRPTWSAMPRSAQAQIEGLVGAPVVAAQSCPGGFSPGFASRLSLADGRRVFVKAMDINAWPHEADAYRTEALVAAALPGSVPAPRLRGTVDSEGWVILAFEDVDATEPKQPWVHTDLDRVVAAISQLSHVTAPEGLPSDHPRLGGWEELACDDICLANLPTYSPWASENLGLLTALEEDGLAAAQGRSLVHFDLYPHNILLTPDRVVFVDWPHARLGAPIIDLVTTLSSAAADGIDPEPYLPRPARIAHLEPVTIDGVIAALAGFCLAGGLYSAPPGLEPIPEFKRRIGLAAVGWLRRRLANRA